MRWVLITFVVFAIVCAALLGRSAVSGEAAPWWTAVLAFAIGMAFGAWRLPSRARG